MTEDVDEQPPTDGLRRAVELHRGAESLDPAAERIARLVGPTTSPSGRRPGPREARERPAGRDRSTEARPGDALRIRRPLLVAGAVAALVILALAVGLAQHDDQVPAPGAASRAGIAGTSPSTSVSADPTSDSPSITARSITYRRTVGDRLIEVGVTPQADGSRHVLGADAGYWVAAPETVEQSPPHGDQTGWPIGPVQPMGSGSRVEPGPFAVTWQGGPTGSGSSGSWLTAPHDFRGAPAGLRIPVRHGAGSFLVTLLVGTTGPSDTGSGDTDTGARLTMALPSGTLTFELPGCDAASCPTVVRITVRSVDGASSPAGDVMLDLSATAVTGRIGFAGGELSPA